GSLLLTIHLVIHTVVLLEEVSQLLTTSQVPVLSALLQLQQVIRSLVSQTPLEVGLLLVTHPVVVSQRLLQLDVVLRTLVVQTSHEVLGLLLPHSVEVLGSTLHRQPVLPTHLLPLQRSLIRDQRGSSVRTLLDA